MTTAAKKNPDQIEQALLELRELAEQDPQAAYELLRVARQQLEDVEGVVLRAALRRRDGLVWRAAKLLGIPRSTFNNLLIRTHKDLAKEVKTMRPSGYRTGRAPGGGNGPE